MATEGRIFFTISSLISTSWTSDCYCWSWICKYFLLHFVNMRKFDFHSASLKIVSAKIYPTSMCLYCRSSCTFGQFFHCCKHQENVQSQDNCRGHLDISQALLAYHIDRILLGILREVFYVKLDFGSEPYSIFHKFL